MGDEQESDFADKTAENVARLLLVAEALGMRQAATMVERWQGGGALVAALRARADRIQRGEDG